MSNQLDLSKVAIVLTSHPKQQKWWAPVLQSLEGFPGPLVLAYDDIDVSQIPLIEIALRFKAVRALGYVPGFLGHGRGELVGMKAGFEMARDLGAEYCLKLGFDEPVYRWRNIEKLWAMRDSLKSNIIDCETRVVFGPTEALCQIMSHVDLIERGPGSAESYWKQTCSDLDFSRMTILDPAWWFEMLGLVHIPGEYAANHGQSNKWAWTIGELWPRPKPPEKRIDDGS